MVRNVKKHSAVGERGLTPHHHSSSSLLIITVLFTLCCSEIHSKDLKSKSACESEILCLDCGELNVIAIHDADFTSDITSAKNASCLSADDEEAQINFNDTCQEDIRIHINRRCSGLSNCNFSYSLLTGRRCDRVGVVNIQYDCVRDSSIYKYCNVQIRSKTGYISSPGYPLYYPQLPKCDWKFLGGGGQTVMLHVLDIHMRTSTKLQGQHQCDDTLTILQGNTRRLMLCGVETESLQTLVADIDEGVAVQFTSQNFYPASGFFIYFKVQGCSTLPAPKDGYLVHRNGSTATYLCCQKYLFNDTLEHSRTLQCIEEHHWNDTLAPCIAVDELKQIYVNHTLVIEPDDDDNLTIAETRYNVTAAQTKASYMEDILIPSVLMVALLIGNALIVIIILRIRRRQKSKAEVEDDDLSPQRSIPEATNV